MNNTFYITDYTFWQQEKEDNLPDISFLPSLFRRRLTDIEKISFYLINNLKYTTSDLEIVFASRFGEWGQTFELISKLKDEHQISPAGFSHSVHNAVPGLFSILTQSSKTYTAISAQEKTIDAAILESLIKEKPVLLVYAEEKTPVFYRSKFEKPFLGHGTALIISDQKSAGSQKILVEREYHKEKSVTFSELIHFLQHGGTLLTEHLKIRSLS